MDIQKESYFKTLVDSFYDKVNKDNVAGPVIVDFEKTDVTPHLPSMYRFWSSLLLNNVNYFGLPFVKHTPLPNSKDRFDRWLLHFNSNIDNYFKGKSAAEVKLKTANISEIFRAKLYNQKHVEL